MGGRHAAPYTYMSHAHPQTTRDDSPWPDAYSSYLSPWPDALVTSRGALATTAATAAAADKGNDAQPSDGSKTFSDGSVMFGSNLNTDCICCILDLVRLDDLASLARTNRRSYAFMSFHMRWHREDWSAWLIQFEWRYLLERRMDRANDEANDRQGANARGWTDDDITLWLNCGGEILDLCALWPGWADRSNGLKARGE